MIFLANAQSDVYKKVGSNGFDLSWKVNGEYLDVKISAECKGWIAIGIDPESAMKGANFILGYVKDGKVFTSDEFGTSRTSHKPDSSLGGTDDVKNAAGKEENGMTEISFSIPLVSNDKYDVKLSKGSHTILLACSNGDNFTSKHFKKAKVEIEI